MCLRKFGIDAKFRIFHSCYSIVIRLDIGKLLGFYSAIYII